MSLTSWPGRERACGEFEGRSPSRYGLMLTADTSTLVSDNDTMARPTIPDLLPGTLDLLILRTLQPGPMHGWAISERVHRFRRMCCKSIRALSTRRSTGSSIRAGSKRNGEFRSWDGGRSTTASPRPAAASLRSTPASGNGCRWRSNGS